MRRLAAPDIAARKGGDPIVCLTAYTAPVAAILDEACDLLLVGDRRSVGGQADNRITALASSDVRRGESAHGVLAVSGQGGVPLRVT